MKPRTKNEKEVTRLSALLPAVSAPQFKWVRSHLFENEGYYNKGEVYCSCCGHVFNADKGTEKAVCPSCGNELTIKKSRRVNVNMWNYFTIITTFKGWQIIRNFKVTKRGTKETKTADGFYYIGGEWRKGKADCHMSYEFHEIGQCWYNAQGEEVLMGVGKVAFSCWQSDIWRHEDLSVKKNDEYIFSANADKIYPRIQILPTLKRNGFKVLNQCIPAIVRTLLRDNRAETIFKAGYYDLFMRIALEHLNIDSEERWDALKICMRNGYTMGNYRIEDKSRWNDYFDYIDCLVDIGKDIHNAHYVCPDDFKKAHDWAMKKAEDARAMQKNEMYIKHHEKFFSLLIEGNGITIFPLKSVGEFKLEGKDLHHCVFARKYYEKNDSLILTARDEHGERLETIEVNLNNYKIIQSRGKHNGMSIRHADIVKLMEDNMNEVKRLARAKTDKPKKKPARVRQAA